MRKTIKNGNTTLMATDNICKAIEEANQAVLKASKGEASIEDILLDTLEEEQNKFHMGFTEEELDDYFIHIFRREARAYVEYLKGDK